MILEGIAKKDIKTKRLVNRLFPGDIAVLKHRDIDEVAAQSLIRCKPRAIINAEKSISGKYPNRGPSILINGGIKIFEAENEDIFDKVIDNNLIRIVNNNVYQGGQKIGAGKWLTHEEIEIKIRDSMGNLEKELDNFIENTLEYAKKEKSLILGNLIIPEISAELKGKQVLVVVRGKDYREDLLALKSYIKEFNPVLIGVDGGGDALLECGYVPDILIGDMDSVSDECLKISKEIVIHAYPDGRAPGLNRVKDLKLKYKLFPSPGTSEDIALLLAYEKEADFIVAVGTHTNMIDFLEKGRKGMASTFLVRLKVGSKLIDAKGVNKLYKERLKPIYFINVFLSSLIPLLMVVLFSPFGNNIIRLLLIKLRLQLN